VSEKNLSILDENRMLNDENKELKRKIEM